MSKKRYLIILFGLLFLVFFGYIYLKKNSSFDYKRPGFNIILIVIDALRADHLPFYGSKLNTAPNLSKLVKDGMLFKNMFSNSPSTKPSIASLFTSAYPSQHKSIHNSNILNDKLVTLAEILRVNKYYTLAVNDNVVISTQFNYNQGFDVWKDVYNKEVNEKNIGIGEGAHKVNAVLLKELDNIGKKPLFIYLHYMDPHNPYLAPEPYLKYFNRDYNGKLIGYLNRYFDKDVNKIKNAVKYFKKFPLELEQFKLFYDNEIFYIDKYLGILFKKLKEKNLYENSIIIVLSDHGEMFLEHGYLYHSNGLYSELVNVPLIIRIPGFKKNIVNETYFQTVDILPTILDSLDIKTDNVFMGKSIFKILKKPNRPILGEHLRLKSKNPQTSLIYEHFKIIENHNSKNRTRFELYNLKRDKFESDNIFYKSEISNRILKKYNLFKSKIRQYYKNIEVKSRKLTEETVKQLRTLGYID